MHSAIIAGTGIYDIPGMTFQERIIDTAYGQAKVNIGTVDGFELVFLARHGLDHSNPPHNINYRANIKALQMLGVKRVAATYAVGSANRRVRPTEMALLTDFMNFTSGRPLTFFEGGDSGLAHTAMDAPYCPAMGRKILELAQKRGLAIKPDAVYVATNGPRFETPAEIRMYARDRSGARGGHALRRRRLFGQLVFGDHGRAGVARRRHGRDAAEPCTASGRRAVRDGRTRLPLR
jgi:5'-methylthioadenosine phosphorylase